MSDLYKCLCCGGVYAPVQADGTIYFHACPPMPDPKTGVPIQRPGHRDENVVMDRAGVVTNIRSEGAGTAPVPPAAKPEPVWITALKVQIAKQDKEG